MANGDGKSDDARALTPVLIIPGFMSSGLAIRKSPHKSWEGTRLWLNLSAAGFNSLHTGGALVKNERRRSVRDLGGDAAAGGGGGGDDDPVDHQSSEEMHQEYVKQMECKSRWVEHMRLQSDLIHEKEGVEIRPIPGTAGVDYLAPGALTESASWVFGPVLKILKAEGYTEGVNLDAAPYDWRIPPSVLESRDNYFSNTMKTVERLYRKSNNNPVVLLCHSMGCRTAHYLLNFVLHRLGKADGQAWIDMHVHSYVPVGAPHLGAQKSIRGVVDGDKMGLEAFLSNEEGLMLGRSLGSPQWLFPFEPLDGADSTATTPPQSTDETLPGAPPIPTVNLRHESTIKIILPAQCLPLSSFTHHRKHMPPTQLRLAIQIGNDIFVRTDFIGVANGGQGGSTIHLNFKDEAWLVACPPTIEQALRTYPYIQLHLEEPGTGSAPKEKKGIFHLDILWVFRCAWCLFKWIFCFPCAVVWKLGCCLVGSAKRGADLGAALLGEIRVIGQSGRVDWKKGVTANNKKTNADGGERGDSFFQICTEIQPIDNERYGFFLTKPQPEKFTIKVKWEPRTFTLAASSNVCHQSDTGKNAVKLKINDHRSKTISYSSCNANQLLQMEGLTNSTRLLKETYGNDPLGPRSLSSWKPPPVKKVIAIYGTNLPTEVSCAYKRNPSVRISNSFDQLFVLDKEAALNKESSRGHVIKDGVISETKDTPQKIIGDSLSLNTVEKRSGDGSVPYWSLQHVRCWRENCDVTVHELDSAEHRAILNDGRFHDILLDLLRAPQSQLVSIY